MCPRDKDMLIEAFKQDFEHARHIENQRFKMATLYVFALLGSFIAVATNGDMVVYIISLVFAVFVTSLCLKMTHTWNASFARYLNKAGDCAEQIKLASGENLFGYIGFPPEPRSLERAAKKPYSVQKLYIKLYRVLGALWVSGVLLLWCIDGLI